MAESVPAREWEETRDDFGARLRRCISEINDQLDVDGLGRGFNKRVKVLCERKGGRLKY